MASVLKYINSTSNLISNSGSDENKNYTGGKAGDQTGSEWNIRSWYSRPWTKMYRYEKDARVGMVMAIVSCLGALNNKVGYDQGQRTTYWNQLKQVGYDPSKIETACEEDCSAGVCANIKATGYLLDIDELKNLSASNRTATMHKALVEAGFTCYTEAKYLTSGNYLMPGDVLLYPSHHTAAAVNKGKYATETAKYVADLDITLGGYRYTGKYGITGASASGSTTPVKTLSLGDRQLSKGSMGVDVKELQEALIKLGYNLGSAGADGDFGSATLAAVRNFQKDHDLEIDGIVGAKTVKAIQNALTQPSEPVSKEIKVKVTANSLYVRKGPGTGYGVKKIIHKDEVYTLYEEKNGFAKISKDESLWSSMKYLQKI